MEPKAEVYITAAKPYFSKSEYPAHIPGMQVHSISAGAKLSGTLPDLITGKPLPSGEVVLAAT